MGSPTFNDMAKRAGVRPVTLVGFESLDAQKTVLTTYDDWSGTEALIPPALSLTDTLGCVTLTGAGPATYTSKIIDFVTPPAGGIRLEIDDITPAGSSIAYTAYGSANYSTWVNLGAVTDGQALVAYRFYKVDAVFNKSGDAPALKELRFIVAASEYTYFSTVKDCPVQGARPYLREGGVTQLANKIELDKISSIGEMSIDLALTRQISDFLATGQMRGKAVTVKLGFEGLDESAFLPYFAGTLQDYSFDQVKQTVRVKARDVWKQFQRKLPADSFFLDATGAKDDSKVYKLSGHVIDVILQIADALGVPARFIDRAAFTSLKAIMPGAEYTVTRSLTEPEDAATLIGELAASFGLFLFPLGTGALTAVSYDSVVSGPPDAKIDARRVTCKPIEAGYKDLVTRIAIYYRLLPGKQGSGKEDYQNVHFTINTDAETATEVKDKEWMDKWGMSGPAIERLAQRFNKWYTTPRKTFKVDQVPPRLIGKGLGSLIAVDYLQLPAPLAEWPGYSAAKTFIITSVSLNPSTLTLSWDLQEADPLNYKYQDLPTYPAYNIFPPVTDLSASERISKRADGTIDTLIDLTWTMDFRFSSVTVLVQENNVAKWRTLANIPAQAGDGSYTFLARDGVPYLFGIRTFNAAGAAMPLDDMPTYAITPIGKAAPPSDVSGVTLTPRGEVLEIAWPHITDADLLGYEIRLGAVWESAAVIVSGYAGNVFSWRPTRTGGLTILVKAIDTTKHYSVHAASATLSVTGAAAPVVKATVIDNQVLLSWTPGDMGTFPLIDYEIRRGSTWAAGVLVGTTAGTTQPVFETAAGVFTYWVAARTAAGTGAPSSVTAAVSSPPDYVFRGAADLAFNGTRTNAIIDGGAVVLPVNATETVAAHFTRVGATTPAGQIAAGYPLYIQPGVASGSYEETVDFTAIVTGAKITADITQTVVAGAVSVSTTISVSAEGSSWTAYEGTTCYATNFRYVKTTILVTTANGGVMRIAGGVIRLDVRFKTLEGTATANASDSGGTVVYITENRQSGGTPYFIDVESIQITPKGPGAIVGCYDFADTPNPTSFKALLWQMSGGAFVRYSGEFSFLLRGV